MTPAERELILAVLALAAERWAEDRIESATRWVRSAASMVETVDPAELDDREASR